MTCLPRYSGGTQFPTAAPAVRVFLNIMRARDGLEGLGLLCLGATGRPGKPLGLFGGLHGLFVGSPRNIFDISLSLKLLEGLLRETQ